jgi:hypothetical protein
MKNRKLKYPIQQVVSILEEYRAGENIYALCAKYKLSPETLRNWNRREDINVVMNPKSELSNQAMLSNILNRLEDLESKLEQSLRIKQYNKQFQNGHFK